jgi:hypothetical protein
VAQGAAYLVPAYAVVKAQGWRRRRRDQPEPVDEPTGPVAEPVSSSA